MQKIILRPAGQIPHLIYAQAARNHGERPKTSPTSEIPTLARTRARSTRQCQQLHVVMPYVGEDLLWVVHLSACRHRRIHPWDLGPAPLLHYGVRTVLTAHSRRKTLTATTRLATIGCVCMVSTMVPFRRVICVHMPLCPRILFHARWNNRGLGEHPSRGLALRCVCDALHGWR